MATKPPSSEEMELRSGVRFDKLCNVDATSRWLGDNVTNWDTNPAAGLLRRISDEEILGVAIGGIKLTVASFLDLADKVRSIVPPPAPVSAPDPLIVRPEDLPINTVTAE